MKRVFLKSALIALTVFFVYAAGAQYSLFVRVYDLQGNKIYKGNVAIVTDSSLQLENSPTVISAKNIGLIKTKHSYGHNVLMSSAIIGGSFAIIGAFGSFEKNSFPSFTATQGVGAGLVIGVIDGIVIGSITALIKNSKTFSINGNEKKWHQFYEYYYSDAIN